MIDRNKKQLRRAQYKSYKNKILYIKRRMRKIKELSNEINKKLKEM